MTARTKEGFAAFFALLVLTWACAVKSDVAIHTAAGITLNYAQAVRTVQDTGKRNFHRKRNALRVYSEVNTSMGKEPYERIETKIANAIPGTTGTSTTHLSLAGAIENYLDGVHMELNARATAEKYGIDFGGAFAQQTQLSDVNIQIGLLALWWPRLYLDSVVPPATADSIAARYKQDAAAMFVDYGF